MIATYLITSLIYGSWTGVIAIFLLAIHPFADMYARVGTLDTMMVMLSMVAALFLLKAESKPAYLYFWGFFCGLALLAKGVHIIPASVLYLIIMRRNIFKTSTSGSLIPSAKHGIFSENDLAQY